MVHIIPLSVAQRRPGNAVRYPVSAAGPQFDDHWQAVAERHEQRMAQQRAFDTEIAARRLNDEIAKAEADAVANAPADGAGPHDAMYGQVDPRTGQVVKTGLFDTLFGDFQEQAPAELRPGLASRKAALREAGSLRMAMQQLQRRKQYEQDQVSAAQTDELDNIARSDPNDAAAFEAARQRGLDLIASMGLDAQGRSQAEAAWRDRTAKSRVEALIAGNPQTALDLLGLRGSSSNQSNLPDQGVDSMTTGSVARNDNSGLSGEKEGRLHKADPSERVGQAFLDKAPIDALLAQLSPGSYDDVVRQARSADAASFISRHANLDTDAQKAKAAIDNMEPYSGSRHDDTEFAQVFGAEEGGKRSRAFNWRADVSPYLADMRVKPTNEVDASIFAAKPIPNRFSPKQDPELYKLDQARFEEDEKRHELNADAAALVIQQRQVDPAAYARRVSPSLDAALKDLSTPQNLQSALAKSFAAQRQLGIAKPQPLPRSDAEGLLRAWGDSPDPEEARRQALEGIADPRWRKALAKQLDDIGLARPQARAADGVDSSADRSDGVDSERPAKFAKSIYLSPADILRLKKAVMTEWLQIDDEDEARGVLDVILNRYVSGHFGNDFRELLNKNAQFTAINSEISRKNGQHDVDQLSISDPRFPRVSNLIDEYLLQRAAGARAVAGTRLNYANPGESDQKSQAWIRVLKTESGLGDNSTARQKTTFRSVLRSLGSSFLMIIILMR